jgi:alpha-mannosidase
MWGLAWFGVLVTTAAALNVHVIPHAHDDPGFLKTVDEYYFGANNSIAPGAVQYVMDSVLACLEANPNRTFAYGEQAFFQRWWREQDSDTQARMKKVVAQGQIEFVNGGWVQHDEATTYYVSMIDQTTLGHTFLKQQFDVRPRIGWQIDTYGHSNTQAALMSSMVGFDALFFGRMDYQDLRIRTKHSNTEFFWQGSKSYGDKASIFTGAFQSGSYGLGL